MVKSGVCLSGTQSAARDAVPTVLYQPSSAEVETDRYVTRVYGPASYPLFQPPRWMQPPSMTTPLVTSCGELFTLNPVRPQNHELSLVF